MVFASPIFLFLFLPATLAAYFAAPRAWRNGVLLVASLVFYAWGEAPYLLLVLGSIAWSRIHVQMMPSGFESNIRTPRYRWLAS